MKKLLISLIAVVSLNFSPTREVFYVSTMQSAISLPWQVPVLFIAGFYTPGDEGQGIFEWSDTVTKTIPGMVIKHQSSIRGGWVRKVTGDEILLSWFGAIPNGTMDCTSAIVNSTSYTNGKTLVFSGGTYKTSGTMALAFSNTVWKGQGDSVTIVTNSDAYSILQPLTFKNARITGIYFNSTYSNSVENGIGIIYTDHIAISNIEIDHCRFSNPSANTDALCFKSNIGDSTLPQNIMRNMNIHNNKFIGIGRICVDIFNRKYAPSGYEQAVEIHVDDNYSDSSGTQGSWGLFVSFDGTGKSCTCNRNYIRNAFKAGIEMNYGNSQIKDNTLEYTSRLFIPIECDPIVPIYGMLITGNKTLGANSYCTFFDVFQSQFSGNNITGNMSTAAGDGIVYLIGSYNTFVNERYTSSAGCLRVSSMPTVGARYYNVVSTGNRFVGCFFTATVGASSRSLVSFDSSLTHHNVISGCGMIKGLNTNYSQELQSAANNVVTLNWQDGTIVDVPYDKDPLLALLNPRLYYEAE